MKDACGRVVPYKHPVKGAIMTNFDHIHEECGVFGIYSPETCNVASTTYYGLFALQHRGQESCGIVVGDRGLFRYYKDSGIVNDVFTPAALESLGSGTMADRKSVV